MLFFDFLIFFNSGNVYVTERAYPSAQLRLTAEKLYGVTMPTKGITKVLSLDINEIEEKLGKLE